MKIGQAANSRLAMGSRGVGRDRGQRSGFEETLRDGRVVALRPLRGDDAAEVEALWRRLDAPPAACLPIWLICRPTVPVTWPSRGPATAGIVAVPADPSGRVVGVARYRRAAADYEAGALVFVDASWRRAGLGTVLFGWPRGCPARWGAAAGR